MSPDQDALTEMRGHMESLQIQMIIKDLGSHNRDQKDDFC
jgi:hypothetical protein